MKIDLTKIDRTQFYVDEHDWCGEKIYLIRPKESGVDWTQENKIFRSSVWNSEGVLISASFPKFTNWGEDSGQFPPPSDVTTASIVQKVDGSTLIVSKYRDQIMIRTRGTIDASIHEKSGHEIEAFRREITDKLILGQIPEVWNSSLIFEWTTPKNRIVIGYGDKPQFFLTGVIMHENYSLKSQMYLSGVAAGYNWLRPKTYQFSSITDLLDSTYASENEEGVCVYSADGQSIHKVKSRWYLARHYARSSLSTYANVRNLWLELGCAPIDEFENFVRQLTDYEIFNEIGSYLQKLSSNTKILEELFNEALDFVKLLSQLDRKTQAQWILKKYDKSEHRSLAFSILDNKDPWKNPGMIKKCLTIIENTHEQ